jgi:peptide/nickel transport system substrate-binding protein
MAAPPAEVAVNPGKLTIMVGDLGNERFDQVFVGGTPGFANYGQIVHGALINSTEKRELVPGIATKWKMSPDGLTWAFTIRKGVKWHDGSELTPEDVLWTFQHSYGPQALEYSISNTAVSITRVLDKIELSGPDTVVLATKEPLLFIDTQFSDTDAGYYPVLPKRATLHDEAEELAYDQNPIGAGFMKLVGHTQAQVMRFERFEDFYYQSANGFPEDKRVKFESLDMFLVPEESTRVAAIQSGEADIVPASIATKEQVEAGGGRMVFAKEGIISQPGLQGCWDPQYPCHDKRVRQALDYAIDKEVIRDRLYGPEVYELKGWMVVTPSTIGYTPELDPFPFDPDKARQLLADAGYPGGKGFGKLIVNVRAATSLPFMVESAQIAADLWRRELGLDVEVRVGDSTALKESRYAGELNGQVYWEENDTRVDAISSASSYSDPEGRNRWSEDPELFQLTQETLQILDPDRREEALKKLWQRLREESYHLGMGYSHTPWAVGPRVLTWQPYPVTLYPSALHTITLE